MNDINTNQPPGTVPAAEAKKKTIALAILIIPVLALIGLFAADKLGKDKTENTPPTYVAETGEEASIYEYTSSEFNFVVDFPSEPKVERNSIMSTELGNEVLTVNHSVITDDMAYFVVMNDYNNDRMNSSNPDFDLDKAFAGALNNMVATYPEASILSQAKTTVGGRQAVRYTIDAQGEILEGYLISDEDRLYIIMADYLPGSSPSPQAISGFLNSFAFIN